MGYTIYWERSGQELKKSDQLAILRKFLHLLKNPPVSFVITQEYIRINGIAEGQCEDFKFYNLPTSDSCFCKTLERPYTKAVKMFLGLAYNQAPYTFFSIPYDDNGTDAEDWFLEYGFPF